MDEPSRGDDSGDDFMTSMVQTGAPLVERAYRREEIYSGECLEEAADIVPKWALQDGQNLNFRISSKSPGSACV